MRAYRFDHLADPELLRLLAELVARARENDAKIVAVIAEVDRRRLYLPAGYASMKAYCVEELRLSEDAALKRIQVARAIAEFPALLEMIADGRLHLTGANLLVPHLTAENQAELLCGATRATKAQIHGLLETQFPAPDLLTVPAVGGGLAPAQEVHELGCSPSPEHAPAHVAHGPTVSALPTREHAPAHVAHPATNRAPRRVPYYLLPETEERIRRAKELLGPEFPSGDDARLIDRAMKEMVERAEKRLLRAAGSTRTRPSSNPRHIPKRVKRAVWDRDRAQCTFVGNTGHRCGTREYLEFDHNEPVARGGASTIENLRLRCRAHNQFEAERAFGAGFMDRKREEAKDAALEKEEQAENEKRARERAQEDRDLLAGLRELGFRADQARRAAKYAARLDLPSLEDRMKAALRSLSPKARRETPVPVPSGGPSASSHARTSRSPAAPCAAYARTSFA